MPPHLPNLPPTPRLLLPLLLLTSLIILNLHKLSSPTLPNKPFANLFLSLSLSANSSISAHLRALTRHPHLAGTPLSATATNYVQTHLKLSGLNPQTQTYLVSLSYPSQATLSLLLNKTLTKTLSLSEPADPAHRFIPPYHSFSPSGSALARLVYANLGRDEDYATLERLAVDVRGCVVVVRRGGGYRGGVVEGAAARGARGVIMFGRGGGGGVERGTVLLGGPGDVLTPGWAASAGAERLGMGDEEVVRRVPRIFSMPVSGVAAREILAAVGGPEAPREWREEVAAVRGVGGGDVMVNFTYKVSFSVCCFVEVLIMVKFLLGHV